MLDGQIISDIHVYKAGYSLHVKTVVGGREQCVFALHRVHIPVSSSSKWVGIGGLANSEAPQHSHLLHIKATIGLVGPQDHDTTATSRKLSGSQEPGSTPLNFVQYGITLS